MTAFSYTTVDSMLQAIKCDTASKLALIRMGCERYNIHTGQDLQSVMLFVDTFRELNHNGIIEGIVDVRGINID